MSLIAETRMENRKCDVCGAGHVDTTRYDAEETVNLRRECGSQNPNYSVVRYPWRVVEVRGENGFPAKTLDCCGPACVASAAAEAIDGRGNIRRVVIELGREVG